MTAIELISDERSRQLVQEGWTAEHDDSHDDGELAIAAACYALPALRRYSISNRRKSPDMWPWEDRWWKPGDRIRELVKAAALIAAEIDRLQLQKARQREEVERMKGGGKP
jgi:hypothetical protein